MHLTQTRNSDLGFALAFPFSSTAQTISGFETFGDNQFATPITLFPDLRNQEKYQFRYDLSHVMGDHALKFGVDFIHEPVLSGAFPGNAETIYNFPQNPTYYVANPSQFPIDLAAGASTSPAPRRQLFAGCSAARVLRRRLLARIPSSHGQLRIALSDDLGLFIGSGRSQADNRRVRDAAGAANSDVPSVPQRLSQAIRPRLGIAYSPGDSGKTVIRAGFGLFYDDLAQNGWATAFQGLDYPNFTTGRAALPGGPGTYALIGGGRLIPAVQWGHR